MNEFFKELFDFSKINDTQIITIAIIFILIAAIIVTLIPTEKERKTKRLTKREAKYGIFTDVLADIKEKKYPAPVAPVKEPFKFEPEIEEEVIKPEVKEDSAVEAVIVTEDAIKLEEYTDYIRPRAYGEDSAVEAVIVTEDATKLEEYTGYSNSAYGEDSAAEAVIVTEEIKPTRINYKKITVVELKAIAKEMGLTGYSRLSKEDLIAFVKNAKRNLK